MVQDNRFTINILIQLLFRGYIMSDNEEIEFNDVASDITIDINALELSASSKKAEQEELSQQIEAFLKAGGKIDVIEPNVLADPPKKPVSNYGSQPI